MHSSFSSNSSRGRVFSLLSNMLHEREDESSSKGSQHGQNLHEDIVTEILSCMSAKSLLRMKLVCKRWCAMIQERKFIEKQMGKVQTFYCFHNRFHSHHVGCSCYKVETFRMVCGFEGLCVVKSNHSYKYFIRNDAIRQILELPKPSCDNIDGSSTLSYVATNDVYKWVYVYTDKLNPKNITCEILNVGIDLSFRPLITPNLDYTRQIGTTVVLSVGTAVHCIRVLEIGLCLETQVTSLDLENESFSTTFLPKGLFSDCRKVCPMVWNGCLGFAERERENVVVTTMEDYKKPEWCLKKICVPLTFIKDLSADEIENLVMLVVVYDEMWFRLNDKKIIVYDIRTRKVKVDAEADEGYKYSNNGCFVGPPSMVTLKGMRPFVTRSTDASQI